jgi:oligopeptide transport system substrate-binding protein
VQVVLEQREFLAFRTALKQHNFMVSRASWYGDYSDPTTFLDIHRTDDGNNDRGYSSPEYDALLDRAGDEADPAARMRLLERAEVMIVEDDVPLIPIWHYSQVYLFDAHRLSGVSSHPRQEQCLYLIDVLGDGKGAEKPLAMPPLPGSAGGRGPGSGAIGQEGAR